MKILFWGTPAFAVPSLRALLGEGFGVAAVVTQPDRPAGRGRKLRPSPVREVAEEEELPVLTPEQPGSPGFLAQVEALRPDLSVVVAYGHILPVEILELPTHGSINVHASLLPRLRGAAPVNWAIIRGDDRTGVTIMRMTAGMDAGPILLQREMPIAVEDTATGLTHRLAELGAEALMEAVALIGAGEAEFREQDYRDATYAPKVDRETARIDWERTASAVADHIRGMDLVPGAWSLLGDEPIKLFSPTVVDRASDTPPPGTFLPPGPGDELVVATGHGGAVRIGEVQPPGKRRMESAAWLRGRSAEGGLRFS
ncbi:MAG: methionyl-tRNA formyltransferase [Gemmatimonadota bacterium]